MRKVIRFITKRLFRTIAEKISLLFSNIKYLIAKLFSSRMALVLTVLLLGFTVIMGRLFYLQIIKSDFYTENFTEKAEKTITTEAARGKIYDRNGYLLAYNEIGYNVVMTDEIPSSNTRGDTINGIIYRTIQIIEENGDRIIDDFNIELDANGNYVFKQNPVTRQVTFLINIFGGTSEEIHTKGYDRMTATELMDYLCGPKKYALDEKYTKEERVKIVTIRYALSQTAYQKYVSTTIANNINENTMAAILESTDDLRGVDVQETYKRVYNDAEYFAHIIGYTGEISESELEEYNIENDAGISYSIGDTVGKSGVEQSYDSFLQGKKGEREVFVDSTGNILETLSEVKSQSGNDLYLTIDRDLQIASYDILEKKIAACLLNKIVDYDYVATEKSGLVNIPVKDVYSQILTNIVDFNDFSDPDASEREKAALAAFTAKQASVIAWVQQELLNTNARPASELTAEEDDYLYLVYKLLVANDIIDSNLIDSTDSIYKQWTNDEVSLRMFLQHAIAENWIDVSAISTDTKYSNSDEIYQTIVDNVITMLPGTRNFSEKIYYYMIYNEQLDPFDICLMLYDQGKLEPDAAYDRLVNRMISPYTYVLEQIEDLVLTPAMLALDPCSGSLCVTDADSGDVLALVSYPTYDNNRLSGVVDSDYWYELNVNDSQPLFNYATSGLTAPGSTFKLCTSVAGLAEDYISTDTVIYDAVVFEDITPSPKCYISPASHGNENLATALRDSCNYFFFRIGYNMGLDEYGDYNSRQALDIIDDYAIQLGLGTKSGVELNEVFPRVSTTDSVRTAIGQGTNGFAVVQLARYVNTVANSGYNYQLTLIDRVIDKNGRVVLKRDPQVSNIVKLDGYEWDTIHYGMRLVVTDGTASLFFTDVDTTVAGKTGTAEEDLYRSNHAAFVGYAPYESPEISFACQIRNCDSTSYPGGVLSEVLQYYFGQTTLEEVLKAPVEDKINIFQSE